jgi:hypothetical protein
MRATMTRCTTGLHTRHYRTFAVITTGGSLLLGFLLAAGCTQTERSTTASQAAMQASQLASTTVTSALAGQNSKPKTYSSGVKFNGRGGYDSSQAQRNALARAHWFRDHHNEVYRPSWPKPVTTKPSTTQPVTAGATTLGRPAGPALTPYGRMSP